jgi:hypothetical protein
LSKQTILFPKPCHEDWNRMTPEGRARFCDSCSKHVHDLVNYTPEEAERLLTGDGTPACVRVNVLADGQVLTRPSLTGRILMAAVVTPAIAAALASSVMANPLTGSIVGSIQTSAKSVTVTAIGAGIHRKVKADAGGNYYVDQLPPGNYRLIFSAPREKAWSLDNLQVDAGTVALGNSRDPQLPPVTKKPTIMVPPMVTAGMPMPPSRPPAKNVVSPAPASTTDKGAENLSSSDKS